MYLAWKSFFFFVNEVWSSFVKMLFGRRFPGGGGGGGLIFTRYVLLVSQSPYLIIAYSVSSYSPHLLGKYVIFAIPT